MFPVLLQFMYFALLAIGTFVVLCAALRVTQNVWNTFRIFVLVRRWPNIFGVNLKAAGSWAVVTGASDGIGKEYALQLARIHRLNVVLISRSIHKLKQVAKEIESSSPEVKTKCLEIDFSGEIDIYDIIESELEQLDIAILVNNVGELGTVDDFTYFHETRRSRNNWNTIRINCNAVTFMTQMVLGRMVAKRRGVIVNVSSSVSKLAGLPYASVYSGTKAYINKFIRTLDIECRNTGVIFQTLTPLAVATKMVGPNPPPIVCSTEEFVRSAIAAIGFKLETHGCLKHNFLGAIFELVGRLPNCIQCFILMSFANDVRRNRRIQANGCSRQNCSKDISISMKINGCIAE